jgi:hypothetical protein
MPLNSKRNYGVVHYGRQVTWLVVVAVRLYRLFVSTLKNKERLNDYFCDLSHLHPRPERRGFTLHMDKLNRSEYKKAINLLKIVLYRKKTALKFNLLYLLSRHC